MAKSIFGWKRFILLCLIIGFSSTQFWPVTGSDAAAQKDELRVLFIGNSLTYANDLPAIVAALAEAAGERRFVYQTVAVPDFSLEDHWNQGQARKAIARGQWDVVVLQQGPSALPESRALLIEYTRRFDEEIKKAGAKTALYMVWPSVARFGDFDRVSESYRLAAEEVKGILFPAGEVWRAAWRRAKETPLYSNDGLHPTPAGSYAAALVIYGKLYASSPVGLPAKLTLRSQAMAKLELPESQAALLQEAALEAIAKFASR